VSLDQDTTINQYTIIQESKNGSDVGESNVFRFIVDFRKNILENLLQGYKFFCTHIIKWALWHVFEFITF